MTFAEEYANKVLNGEIIAGRLIKKSCERFLSDLKRDDIYFDEKAANNVINFIERYCCHWEDRWSGLPVVLELWQKFVLQNLFGWKWKDSGRRRFKKGYIQVARKNAKSTLIALIADYHLLADEDIKTPQIFVGANNEDQAKICVNSAARIIQKSPKLQPFVNKGIVDIYQYKGVALAISNNKKNGSIRAMSRDAGTKDGFNPSLGIIDEYHEAKDDSLLNVIESGQGARENPLLLVITTAGFNKYGPCYNQLRKISVDILEGKVTDDSHFAAVYEQDPEDDWQDENTFLKSNPNLGVSVQRHFLKDRLISAKNEGGTKEVDFKTKNLNIWTDASTVWISDEDWMKCYLEPVKWPSLSGITAFGGCDLASTTDLAALSVNWEKEGKLYVKTWYWMPKDNIEKRTKEGFPYREWVDKRYIEATPGNVIDYDYIYNRILAIKREYNVKSYAFDPHNATQLLIKLSNEAIGVTELRQNTMNLSPATKELEKRVVSKSLVHDGNPVTRWMMGNIEIYTDGNGNIKIDKGKSINKIDGPASIVNSIAEWLTLGQNKGSVYDIRELREV